MATALLLGRFLPAGRVEVGGAGDQHGARKWGYSTDRRAGVNDTCASRRDAVKRFSGFDQTYREAHATSNRSVVRT